jgi:hypothetical protein
MSSGSPLDDLTALAYDRLWLGWRARDEGRTISPPQRLPILSSMSRNFALNSKIGSAAGIDRPE